MKKVAVGMSGGVDSSVSAYLLQKQGYEVIGITMVLFEKENDTSIQDAKKVCEKLNIEHHIIELKEEFKSHIINKFIDSYLDGKTPNPCIECNKRFKFGLLWKKAQELGCDYIATGHYANIIDNKIIKTDSPKDQTYFLYNIDKNVIPHIIFPLSNYPNKEEIRKIAEEQDLIVFKKKDSQDICFIEKNYTDFLEQNLLNLPDSGDFILTDGTIIGKHKGIIYYTIGQRKGLGISYKTPLYVIKIDKESNQIILGSEEDLLSSIVYITDINILTDYIPSSATAKIRYKFALTECNIEKIDDNNLKIIFNKPVRAATPGQSLVLYDNDILIGGGIISDTQ